MVTTFEQSGKEILNFLSQLKCKLYQVISKPDNLFFFNIQLHCMRNRNFLFYVLTILPENKNLLKGNFMDMEVFRFKIHRPFPL